MSIKNCPNCGAPVVSNKCDYCGTYIFDMSFKVVGADKDGLMAVMKGE